MKNVKIQMQNLCILLISIAVLYDIIKISKHFVEIANTGIIFMQLIKRFLSLKVSEKLKEISLKVKVSDLLLLLTSAMASIIYVACCRELCLISISLTITQNGYVTTKHI